MFRWTIAACCVSAMLTVSCAGSPPSLAVATPSIDMPQVATRPCRLDVLPPSPTISDLEISYVARGSDLVDCDAARRLAVETFEAQRLLTDVASDSPKRSWPRGTKE